MSPLALALRDRFDEVCRSELQRLRKKTAAFAPEERAEIDAISIEVTHGIAAALAATLERPQGQDIEAVVAKLFAVTGRQ